ncbi:DUF4190 domain-containing protein [Nocardioides humi]|uniref:DUF4190 domain-containing protein n=1 Tax=Nocardioides humi TaxID=449461 RepID=A0ABN2BAC2_9ACTN|nr:DUF4190 domain-containing protein [Nocardioides humi]
MTTPPSGNDPYQPYGQPPNQPYGQPAAPYGYTPPPATNGMAIASLVVSIVSLVVCAGFTGFIGAILGHVAKSQMKRTNEQGGGLALAGIIVGWLGFALFIVGAVLFVALVVWAENSIDDCYTDSDGYFTCD